MPTNTEAARTNRATPAIILVCIVFSLRVEDTPTSRADASVFFSSRISAEAAGEAASERHGALLFTVENRESGGTSKQWGQVLTCYIPSC
ncbi:MAG: hypothetical protein M9935_07535 [Kiritimatiellae bacterium]|nr:hypothetical protein [Kiritimatiellia bacterium]